MSSTLTHTITQEMLPAMEGVIPSIVMSCSLAGEPNITGLSQAYYVDETHIALSQQFFNKTMVNLSENPVACVIITCPVTYVARKLLLRFVDSQTSGPIFESMKLQLDVIASMQMKEGVFALRAADIYEVISIETLK